MRFARMVWSGSIDLPPVCPIRRVRKEAPMRPSYLAIVVFTGQVLFGQAPAIGRNGARNAASQIPLSLANQEIARGALLSITGVRLAPEAKLGAVALHAVSATPT